MPSAEPASWTKPRTRSCGGAVETTFSTSRTWTTGGGFVSKAEPAPSQRVDGAVGAAVRRQGLGRLGRTDLLDFAHLDDRRRVRVEGVADAEPERPRRRRSGLLEELLRAGQADVEGRHRLEAIDPAGIGACAER